jgi:hypothetical protein
MKSKKKESSPSRFTRGEKVGGKRSHHGRKSHDKKEEMGSYGQMPKENEEVPTA